MRQALRQVRDAQGPDAVILSSRRISGGVEVVAAVDYDVDEAEAASRGARRAGRALESRASRTRRLERTRRMAAAIRATASERQLNDQIDLPR